MCVCVCVCVCVCQLYIIYISHYILQNGTAEEASVETVQEEEHKSETDNIQV